MQTKGADGEVEDPLLAVERAGGDVVKAPRVSGAAGSLLVARRRVRVARDDLQVGRESSAARPPCTQYECGLAATARQIERTPLTTNARWKNSGCMPRAERCLQRRAQ